MSEIRCEFCGVSTPAVIDKWGRFSLARAYAPKRTDVSALRKSPTDALGSLENDPGAAARWAIIRLADGETDHSTVEIEAFALRAVDRLEEIACGWRDRAVGSPEETT